jgi:comEA protein
MKRRLFFWLEKLKISRNERVAVSVLMLLLLLFATANALLPQRQPYDEAYYAEIEQVFRERSRMIQQKEEAILERYRPVAEGDKQVAMVADTVMRDSLEAGRPDSGDGQSQNRSKININTAGASELQKLPGIGPAYAGRIIAYRQKNGPFSTYDQLLEIKGIGKKRLEKLLPFIQLKGSNKK